MSILITSISNKRPMVSAFSEAARKIGWQSIGCDLDSTVPAIQDIDIFCALPPSHSDDFASALLATVQTHQIKLIIPSRDGDLLPLAELADQLNELGCLIPLPTTKTVLLCQDKLAFSYKLKECDLSWVPTYSELPMGKETFFSRPRFGSASTDTQIIYEQEKAQEVIDDPNLLLHPHINAPEYSIDLLMDLSGQPLEAVTRRRIRIVDGESKKTQVIELPKLRSQAMKLGKMLGLRGHNVLQAFLPEDGDPIFIEANLRFGGASILSVEAGMNSPKTLINLAAGLSPDPSLYETINFGLTLHREEVGDIEVDRFTQ